MARPLTEDAPIDTSLNCKISEEDMGRLRSMSYTTGFTKSEVVRRMIRFAYVFINDATYRVRLEEEASGKRCSMSELRDKINEKIEEEYIKYFDPATLKKGDLWLISGEIPLKVHKFTAKIIEEEDKK